MTAPSTEQTLRLVRWLPATPEAVFAAWTDAKSLQAWMCPDPVYSTTAELDVRVGGCFRIVMRHGEHETVHTGVYREVQPPERLVFTWVSTTTQHQTTLVTVELRPLDDGTELVLTHEGFPDAEAAALHDNGWQSIAAKLVTHLAQGA
ncbi:MAG: hypothetical protein ETSY1_17095 [Candidatus Entotheonella factor]|uniref:Activator of Hsp90 ATPase homologue 1/2-like C-terminal domain-containing protein n=1 Tax=Entotheonella factor TaxID=1429438 RepID=W4LLU6_ENTF1|nr:SRPBCC domain-containing protein [Candidatus Entotheonella palauensis]ETW98874.1 MAG: hypothetical protein ETSY1_17095 [Candidatus Entotheonella factor]